MPNTRSYKQKLLDGAISIVVDEGLKIVEDNAPAVAGAALSGIEEGFFTPKVGAPGFDDLYSKGRIPSIAAIKAARKLIREDQATSSKLFKIPIVRSKRRRTKTRGRSRKRTYRRKSYKRSYRRKTYRRKRRYRRRY